jgi:hypothetical protein
MAMGMTRHHIKEPGVHTVWDMRVGIMGWYMVVWWVCCMGERRGRQLLFPRTFLKVKVPPKFDVFGMFCDEDGMRTFPSIELIGAADW